MVSRSCAADISNNAWPVIPFTIAVKSESVTSAGTVYRAYVSSGTNVFSFVIPADFRLGDSSPQKMVMVGVSHASHLTLRIFSPMSSEPKAEFYRNILLSSYTDARVTDEFSRSAANHTGLAFDLLWKNSAGGRQFARVAFIPTPAGILEFSLITTPDKFSGWQNSFDSWLLSIRSNATGKSPAAPSTPSSPSAPNSPSG